MKISIVGNDTLAAATRFGCSKFHEIVDKSECPDILWACYDTPISANGDADYKWVIDNISEDILSISTKTLIIISSQIQIGTIRHMETEFPDYTFCYVPENIRVATANDDFIKQSRIIAGRRSDKDDELICSLLTPFTEFILYTTPETAEMVKHALNCWLGMNMNRIRVARSRSVSPPFLHTVTSFMRTCTRVMTHSQQPHTAPHHRSQSLASSHHQVNMLPGFCSICCHWKSWVPRDRVHSPVALQ